MSRGSWRRCPRSFASPGKKGSPRTGRPICWRNGASTPSGRPRPWRRAARHGCSGCEGGRDMRLGGQVAAITGSSMGIGEAIAWAYAREGARLVINSRSEERGERVARALRGEGHEAIAVAGDVRDAATGEDLAAEWARHGIRVVSIDPAYIKTPMDERDQVSGDYSNADIERRTPAGRFGTAEEVAKVATFLATDDAAYITGSCVTVDGGWVAYGGW